MCGRFGLDIPPKALQEHFQLPQAPDFPAHCNISPGSQVLGVYHAQERADDGGRPDRGRPDGGSRPAGEGRATGMAPEASVPRAAGFFRWGLVPHWSREFPTDARMINARSETAFDKPSFREPMRSRRLLVPATVFYEWQSLGKDRPKQPWAFRLASGAPMALAGIWDHWRGRVEDRETAGEKAGEETVVSLAILTCAPNDLAAKVHDRMPVILEPERFDAWLDPATPPGQVAELLAPLAAWKMEAFKVGRAVNNPLNSGPECLAPARSEPTLFD